MSYRAAPPSCCATPSPKAASKRKDGALQEHETERVGGTRPIPTSVRLIAATNHDLTKMVAEKQFRNDLFLPPQSHSGFCAVAVLLHHAEHPAVKV